MTEPNTVLAPSVRKGMEWERAFCAAHGIPFLGILPHDRLRSILAYRNDRRLYRRKCDWSGESIISCYHADTLFPVIKSELWWGDGWEGVEYALSAQPEVSFFEQFAALQRRVPREATTVVNAENSSYNSHTRDSKNCYLSHLAFRCEDILYSYWSVNCKDNMDCLYAADSTLCCECAYVLNCYNCIQLEEGAGCHDCYFSYQLRGCDHCLFCSNLVSKSYHIENKPCAPAEFEARRAALLDRSAASYASAVTRFVSMRDQSPKRALHALNCEDVSGEHIQNCKSCLHAFDARESRDCFNVTNGGGCDIYHGYSVGFPSCEVAYCSVTIRNSKEIFFCANCWDSHALWYCDNCVNCSDCFGCVGLKRKQYCVFNVQYTSEDYHRLFGAWREAMLTRGEWGHFFPLQLSPFCYNESVAQDLFSLSREQIATRGCRYREASELLEIGEGDRTLQPGVRLSIDSLSGGEILSCERCSQRYRVVKKEVELLRQWGVPPQARCPDCRMLSRLERRPPYQLFSRTCAHCHQEIESAYEVGVAPTLLCEECFLGNC